MNTKKLRQKILDLATHGKLVPQDLNDESAEYLLQRAIAEKAHLIIKMKFKSKSDSNADRETLAVKGLIGANVEAAKRSELHTFAVIPKRWIVERSFGWLDKCRRLWKNCERKIENTLYMVKLAFIRVLLKRF